MKRKNDSEKEKILEDTKNGVLDMLKKTIRPEFLNRIDDIIMFDQLDKEAIRRIIEIELKGLYKRVEALGFTLQISEAAKDFIATKG